MTPLHLLVVDDDVDFADSMAEVLKTVGIRATVVNSGEAALEKVEAQPFDLVLLDMKMRGMHGIDCLAGIRRLRPGTRVMMVTAFTRGEMIKQALELGAVVILRKPVQAGELSETVSFLPAGASLLLVGDDADLAESTRALLERQGCRVRVAGTLRQAQEALASMPVELILLNYRLPDGTEADLIAWLKARGGKYRVVVMTGYPELALDDLPCISPQDIVVKPFEFKSLLGAMGLKREQQRPGV